MHKDWHNSQRGWFAGQLFEEMKKNKDIVVIVADLGYGMFDRLRDAYPDRFLNVGASEQAAVGLACGMALKDKIPFVYTITSFFLRAAETINIYLDNGQIPVKLVGSGRDDDYGTDGFTHYAYKTQDFLRSTSLVQLYPDEKEQVPDLVKKMINNNKPTFISLRR